MARIFVLVVAATLLLGCARHKEASPVQRASPSPSTSQEPQKNSEKWARNIAIEAAKQQFNTDVIEIGTTKETEGAWIFTLAKPFGTAVGVVKNSGEVHFLKAM